MKMPAKDMRSADEKARDTASIIGSWKLEGYMPTAAEEAVHRQVERGEMTDEEAIAIFRERALAADAVAARRGSKGS